jgi:hypothetical protein
VCKAGSGPPPRGEGTLPTLGGALRWAGARAVVQSREDLFLEEHLDLLEHFYAALRAQASPAAAMQQARAAMAPKGSFAERVLRAQLQVLGLGHERF